MKKILFAAPLVLAASAVLAAPASAATWNNAGQLRAEIAQLDKQVDRTRGLSKSEKRVLEQRVNQLQAHYRSYARNGFTRSEISRLNTEINQVRTAIARQSHDRNNHPGRNHR